MPTVVMNRPAKKSSRLARAVVACLGAVALCGFAAATALAQPDPQTVPGDPLDPRTYAPESKPFLTVYASGVQKYTCQPNGTWLFTDPEATLFRADRVDKPIGTHFLNFATGRPVWQLNDGSSVEAARTATAPGGAGNIAWLLLQAVETAPGSDGDRLDNATWVQRLNTAGGAAPAGSCTPGEKTAIPYTTDYVFWKALDA